MTTTPLGSHFGEHGPGVASTTPRSQTRNQPSGMANALPLGFAWPSVRPNRVLCQAWLPDNVDPDNTRLSALDRSGARSPLGYQRSSLAIVSVTSGVWALRNKCAESPAKDHRPETGVSVTRVRTREALHRNQPNPVPAQDVSRTIVHETGALPEKRGHDVEKPQ